MWLCRAAFLVMISLNYTNCHYTIPYSLWEVELYRPRTLGPREAGVLAWLETDRPATIEVADVAGAVGVSREYARTLVARLERKGWLQRLTRGRYEPLLGASGGWPAPDPWAALDGWIRPYYVSSLRRHTSWG